jgi:hypothetical protein
VVEATPAAVVLMAAVAARAGSARSKRQIAKSAIIEGRDVVKQFPGSNQVAMLRIGFASVRSVNYSINKLEKEP